jgi:hypothetical protein
MPLPKGTPRVFREVQPLRVLELTAWAEDLVATVDPALEEVAQEEELVQAEAVAAVQAEAVEEDTVNRLFTISIGLSFAYRIRQWHSEFVLKGGSESHWTKKPKEDLIMKDRLKVNARKWLVVGGLLLLMSITSVGLVQAVELTDTEKSWLTYMREEEKLARDVYIFMYEKWGSQIFSNISVSEQSHMDAIKTLLDRYGIPDPAAGKGPGVFTNQDLQDLYNALIEDGSVSLVEALEVGVVIEETDIDDLNAGIASTKRKDIRTVYNNLLQGSLNHLKAFVSNLAMQGVIYEP